MFEWWSGFNPDVMIIPFGRECPLHRKRFRHVRNPDHLISGAMFLWSSASISDLTKAKERFLHAYQSDDPLPFPFPPFTPATNKWWPDTKFIPGWHEKNTWPEFVPLNFNRPMVSGAVPVVQDVSSRKRKFKFGL